MRNNRIHLTSPSSLTDNPEVKATIDQGKGDKRKGKVDEVVVRLEGEKQIARDQKQDWAVHAAVHERNQYDRHWENPRTGKGKEKTQKKGGQGTEGKEQPKLEG